jgi:hypothetical protein
MPKAPAAPFTRDVDISSVVRCSRSRVDAGRGSQCSPSNSQQEEDPEKHREEDGADPPGRSRSQEHQEGASSRGGAPQKPDRPLTRQVSPADGGFGGLLSQLSVRAEGWDGED